MLDAPIVQRVDLDQRRAGEPPREQRLQGRQGRVSSTITRDNRDLGDYRFFKIRSTVRDRLA